MDTKLAESYCNGGKFIMFKVYVDVMLSNLMN